ncbi:MAG: glycosyltransferase, partial [Dehalococcoidia bacterium]|nr:glycosyltransferase [Dehalococcoidia bacterium]
MRLAIVMPRIPYPVDSGGDAALFYLIRGLSQRHQVTAIMGVWSDEEMEQVSALEDAWNDNVTLLPARVKGRSGKRKGLLPFMYDSLSTLVSAELEHAVAAVLAQGQIDAMEFHFIQTASIAPAVAPVPLLLVEHEIPHIRAFRQLQIETNWFKKWQGMKNYHFFKKQELQLYRRFDKLLTFTEADRAEILRLEPSLSVSVSPFGVDTNYLKPVESLASYNGLVYLGGEDHSPNLDALRYFLSTIFPMIQHQRLDIVFTVVGRYSNERRAELTALSEGRIRFSGFVPDFRPYLSGAIMVVPLRIGSGMRTKILEAMALGCPVVSTSIGCEGITALPGTHILVEDDPKSFAHAVLRLIGDPILRQTISGQAR